MKRREFVTLLGSAAAAWPLAARAQEAAMPVIGLLGSGSTASMAHYLGPFHEGLNATGYAEGKNLRIEYRWAEDQGSHFTAFAADLVDRSVNVITAIGSPSVLAAQRATNRIPIVFYVGVDPVAFGLAVSLNRPGGNLTGVTNFSAEVAPKLLQLLHELIPSATSIALLVNPTNPAADMLMTEARKAVNSFGVKLYIVQAGQEPEFEPMFARVAEMQAGGLAIAGDPFFNSRAHQLGALARKYGLPTIYQTREFALAGGLMSYGSSFADLFRVLGEYTGRVLHGEKPADLPIQQPTRVELIVNSKVAKALGIELPLTLLARADEVIE